MSDEPAGYLGGAQAPDVDDPYADPYGSSPGGDEDNPYGGEEEVAGFLGGAEGGEEELPALPPQEGYGGASDYLGQDDAGYGADDPYADQQVAEDFQDPYALPPKTDDYDQYDSYDADAMAESDPSYFDSMGHDADGGAATQEMDYSTQEFEDDSPKTISQQDAESIIRRITTKRILPPESEAAQLTPTRLTSSSGGLRIWPIALVLLILAGGAVYVFRVPIAEAFPELAPWLGVELEKAVVEETVVEIPLEVRLKNAMMDKVLKSELKAFGASKGDIKQGKPVDAATQPGQDAGTEEGQ